MTDGGKQLAVFGMSVIALAFALFVPFWGGDVLNIASSPTIVHQFFQIGFVVLFLSGVIWVIGNA